MRVKVQRYVEGYRDFRYGVFVKYWWWPLWIEVDYWDSEAVAIKHATEIKYPKITEIT